MMTEGLGDFFKLVAENKQEIAEKKRKEEQELLDYHPWDRRMGALGTSGFKKKDVNGSGRSCPRRPRPAPSKRAGSTWR